MKCKATIDFGDNFGDNTTTFHCGLDEGHSGMHEEKGDMGSEVYKMPYTLQWKGDEAEFEQTFLGSIEEKDGNERD